MQTQQEADTDYYDDFPDSSVILNEHKLFEGHTARIFSLAVCTLLNGNRIAASASHDRTIRVWCLNTNTCLRVISYSDFVWRVFLVLSPQGKVCVIAFISAENKIHVSDLDSGEELHVIPGRLIYAGVYVLYQGPVIVTLVNEVDVAIFDACNGRCIRHIHRGFTKAFRAVISLDRTDPVLVFSTWDSQTRRSSLQAYHLSDDDQGSEHEESKQETLSQPTVSNVDESVNVDMIRFQIPIEAYNSKNMKSMFVGDSQNGVSSVAISQSTTKPVICSGHYDHVIRVWDLLSNSLMSVLTGHNDWVISVTVWRGSDPIAISGSSDGNIKVWDYRSQEPLITCRGHTRDVWAVTVTPGKNPLIVSASSDKTVRCWDTLPILREMKWSRRKHWVMLVSCIKNSKLSESIIVEKKEDISDLKEGSNICENDKESTTINCVSNVNFSMKLFNICSIECICSEIASYL